MTASSGASTPAEYAQEYVDRGAERLGLHGYPDPPRRPDGPAVVIWPAMGTPARFYRPLATSLREAGLGVVVVDLRGTGSSTPPPSRRSRYGYGELAADVGAVLAALKPRLAGRRVVLLGHSLGGQVCALHLGISADTEVDGLVLVAVGLPWYRTTCAASCVRHRFSESISRRPRRAFVLIISAGSETRPRWSSAPRDGSSKCRRLLAHCCHDGGVEPGRLRRSARIHQGAGRRRLRVGG